MIGCLVYIHIEKRDAMVHSSLCFGSVQVVIRAIRAFLCNLTTCEGIADFPNCCVLFLQSVSEVMPLHYLCKKPYLVAFAVNH